MKATFDLSSKEIAEVFPILYGITYHNPPKKECNPMQLMFQCMYDAIFNQAKKYYGDDFESEIVKLKSIHEATRIQMMALGKEFKEKVNAVADEYRVNKEFELK